MSPGRIRQVENRAGKVEGRGLARVMPRGRHRLTEAQHAEIRRHFRAAFMGSTPEQVFARFASGHHGKHDKIRAYDMLRGVRIHLRLNVEKLPDEDVMMLFLELDTNGRDYIGVDELVEYVNLGATKFDFSGGGHAKVGHGSDCLRASRARGAEKFGHHEEDPSLGVGGVPRNIVKMICARLKSLSIQEYVWKHCDAHRSELSKDKKKPWLAPSNKTVRDAIFEHVDLNGDGKLGVGEFHDVIRHSLKVSVFDLNDEGIMHLVDALDTDRSGFIDLDELHVLLQKGDAYADDDRKENGAPALPELAERLQLDKTWVAPRAAQVDSRPATPERPPSSRKAKKRPLFRGWGANSKRAASADAAFLASKEASEVRAAIAEIHAAPPTAKTTELSLFPNILLEPKKKKDPALTLAAAPPS